MAGRGDASLDRQWNTIGLLSDFDAECDPKSCTRERKGVRSGMLMPFEKIQRNTFSNSSCLVL